MKELIKVIAFDADDTLWSNEPFFQDIEKQYTDLLSPTELPKIFRPLYFKQNEQPEMSRIWRQSFYHFYGRDGFAS